VPDPIRAADPPIPLPSEVLAGQGVAAFVLRPADLDRLPVLTTYPPEPAGDEHAACRAIQAGEREAAEEQADALRAEVARLSAYGTEQYERAERLLADRDAARRQARDLISEFDAQNRRGTPPREARRGNGLLVIPKSFLPTPEHPAALRVDGPGLVEYDGHELRVTYDMPVDGTLAASVRVAPPRNARPDPALLHGGHMPGEVVELYREEECPNPACAKLAHRGPCSEDLPDLADDPRRPRPDWYPDDAVTLSYRELRQLLGLHLERCAQDPDLARAMRDGESPLHLAEVLDR
jgi:hypothetical protein